MEDEWTIGRLAGLGDWARAEGQGVDCRGRGQGFEEVSRSVDLQPATDDLSEK